MNRRSLELCCVLARLVAGGPLCHPGEVRGDITGHSFSLMEGGGAGGGEGGGGGGGGVGGGERECYQC